MAYSKGGLICGGGGSKNIPAAFFQLKSLLFLHNFIKAVSELKLNIGIGPT